MQKSELVNESPDICVIVLAYNEEKTIREVLDLTRATLQKQGCSFEILVVDDGSRDATPLILQEARKTMPELRVVQHDQNRGIGKSIHTGFTNARGQWILYMCSDLQFAPEDIAGFFPYMQDHDVIVGTRPVRLDSIYRKIISKGYHLAMRWMLGVKVTDTNWIQAYRGTLVRQFCLETQDSQILTEMLIKSSNLGARIIEIPTRHFPRTCGKAKGASPYYIAHIAGEIFGLWRRSRHWGRA